MYTLVFYKRLLVLASLSVVNAALGHTPTSNNEEALTEIEVTGTKEGQSSLSPNKVLSGNELGDKLQDSLGATLGNELGVSSSGFGAGAARPVMRGLEGPRVQILQNGLSVNDVSSISPDHAVANPTQNVRQIELLRGASALMYGSGSSGGLINVINDRISTSLPGGVTGEFNTSYETANQGKSASGVIDAQIGSVAIHLDGAASNANDYRIPGYAEQGGPNANWAITPSNPPVNVPYYGKLPFSFNQQNNIGAGMSYIGQSGYTGISYENLNHSYGIPSSEGGFIKQSQNRYDLQHQTNNPFAGFSTLKFSLSNGDYTHNEYTNTGTPATVWKNNSTEARLTLSHEPILGWTGNFGVQLSTAQLTATDVASGTSAIVPQTRTNSNSLFWVGESSIGNFKNSLGVRYNYLSQAPNTNSVYASSIADYSPPNLQNRQFNLLSYSAGSMWNFHPQYGAGITYTASSRAPNASELYGYGPHEATATFIVGNSSLSTETSHNLELSLQKTAGLIQGKANLYLNKFNNYIYGNYTGANAGGNYENFPVVVSQQANATIRGVEAELTHNWKKSGVGSRVFTDASWGVFDAGGNLPLQPAPRVGAEVGYQINKWRLNTTFIHAYTQTRLASFEIGPTPSYNLLNAGVSYSQRFNHINWTAYLRLTNLLNQDIRYATTPETIRLYAPQMGRSAMLGIKGSF
jgi:iron complex outermembrane receptor protein